MCQLFWEEGPDHNILKKGTIISYNLRKPKTKSHLLANITLNYNLKGYGCACTISINYYIA